MKLSKKQPELQTECGCDRLKNHVDRDSIGQHLLLPWLVSVSKTWENSCRHINDRHIFQI